MASDKEQARRRLLVTYATKTAELERRRIELTAKLSTAAYPNRRRNLQDRLSKCMAEISDNELQGAWLRGEHTAH